MKSRHVSLNRVQRQNSSPPTPSLHKSRPLPGPSPLSLKRSASFGNPTSVEHPRKRRTRSSDVIFQKRVSSLLEQAQSMFDKDGENGKIVERSSSPHGEVDPQADTSMEEDDFAFDGDLDLLEAELHFDPLSSDGLNKMDVETGENGVVKQEQQKEANSDDLFDVTFDDLAPEELEALDQSSNAMAATAPQTTNEDDLLFGDGYDELMDLDFDDTQPEVFLLQKSSHVSWKILLPREDSQSSQYRIPRIL
jgi:hypothetical protein